MSSNIKGVSDSLGQVSDIASKARKASGADATGPSSGVEPVAATDAVSFTATAAKMREIEGSLRNVPVVDTQHVAEVKQAIADGTYEVNHARIAEKMAKFEGLLDEVGPKSN
jgi:negative regulator of flagellin synthesis FlgM